MKRARRLLSLIMKTIQYLCRQLLGFLRFGQEVILYAMIFISAFFRDQTSLGCELVAIRSQLTFYKESIRQKKQTRPRFTPAFRLLWVLLSVVWSQWKRVADLMQPKTVLKWHEQSLRPRVSLPKDSACETLLFIYCRSAKAHRGICGSEVFRVDRFMRLNRSSNRGSPRIGSQRGSTLNHTIMGA